MAKFILGIVLIAIGAWLLLPVPTGLPYQGAGWEDFKVVLLGVVPAFLIFLGCLTVWIETEDMKAERKK